MPLNCGFLAFNGFSNMVLASAIEPLRAARDYAGADTFSWALLSPDGRDVVSSSGVTVRCRQSLKDVDRLDILFLVAGYGAREHASSSIRHSLQLADRRCGQLGALDSGAWILAAAGLLSGHKATIHWQDINHFAESYLDIEVVNSRFVIDSKRITAGGATTVTDLMLNLIARHGGGALAFDVSNMFVYDSRARAIDDRGARSLSLASRAPQLLRAINEMRANIEQPLELKQIAEAAAVAPRTLSRLFQREFGIGPGRYYQNIRLETARSLAEETFLSANEIAARSGFSAASTLSRAFHEHFGGPMRKFRLNRLSTTRRV